MTFVFLEAAFILSHYICCCIYLRYNSNSSLFTYFILSYSNETFKNNEYLQSPTFKAYFEFILLLNFKDLKQSAFPDSITLYYTIILGSIRC